MSKTEPRKPSKFTQFSNQAAKFTGQSYTFGAALLLILIWAVTGPIFKFNDTWQLVINTGTTIVTFLMVFLIQNTQNRDTVAMQIKLDEIISSIDAANDDVLDSEELEEKDLDEYRQKYLDLAQAARQAEEEVEDVEELVESAQQKLHRAQENASETSSPD